MASRTLQPSEYEIQREVEALRDIRRRSTTPLTIDPDLPNQSPPSSPTGNYWSGGSAAASSLKDSDSSSSSHEGSTSSHRSNRSRSTDATSNPTDDPFHLFWVPASLHPEIAPAEFRAFLKEHSRSPDSEEDVDTPEISNSVPSLSSSLSLSRKRSMLSRQYRPSENDEVEDESVVPLKRNRNSLYANRGPQLTINDLQRLEELAEEASESDDPSKLRNVLRRSLSLNLSPLDKMDDMPEMGDEADAPIIVPPPGQILRRAARTKIRKPGLPGDGGGHRFGASRRGAAPQSATTSSERRDSSEMSSSDHGDHEANTINLRRQTFSDESYSGRPDSYSEETSIYDAYARDDDEEVAVPVVVTSPPSAGVPQPPQPSSTTVDPALFEALGPVIHQPQPQRLLTPQTTAQYQQPSRTPSPQEPPLHAPDSSPVVYTPSASPSLPATTPSPPSQYHKKDKDKKSGLFKWGGDKGGKKSAKEKDRENRERAEKEKDSGFFGSLFGKKKPDSDYTAPLGSGLNAGREAAQALLGASKSSKSYVPPTSPGLAPGGPDSYSRYPIHVERAIYRLSHIKLANPRRPLYEQVLISNLMFWYLGVINKAQSAAQSEAQTGASGAPAAGAANGAQNGNGKEDAEVEQREREQRERVEMERLERERQEKEQREREMEMKKKESGRRGSLTKTSAGGTPGGGRRAEIPIRGPQYEMQHRVMEQEYGGYNGSQQGVPIGRSSAPPMGSSNDTAGQQYARVQQQVPQYSIPPTKLVQPHAQSPIPDQFYYQPERQQQQQQQQPRLPPGAMPPIDHSGWMSQQSSQQIPLKPNSPGLGQPNSPVQHRQLPPSGQQQPPMNLYKINTSQESLGAAGGHKTGRSLSATAVSPVQLPQANGKTRKGHSAHAAAPSYGRRPRTSEGHPVNGVGEEEDVPLAVWQQQRRK